MTEWASDPSVGAAQPGLIDRVIASLLQTPWLMRTPIPIYRAGFGWIFGDRLVMIEHRGRVSNEPRYVVVEVVEREHNRIRVASGLGPRSQWYRNLEANGVAYLSSGRARRISAHVQLMPADQAAACLERYAADHPAAWRRLKGAMDAAAGGHATIPMIQFSPPTSEKTSRAPSREESSAAGDL